MTDKLLPCPLCDAAAYIADTPSLDGFWCECDECMLEGYIRAGSRKDAVAKWNRRAPSSAADVGALEAAREAEIIEAYKQGARWWDANMDFRGAEYLDKAAGDYADKTMGPPFARTTAAPEAPEHDYENTVAEIQHRARGTDRGQR